MLPPRAVRPSEPSRSRAGKEEVSNTSRGNKRWACPSTRHFCGRPARHRLDQWLWSAGDGGHVWRYARHDRSNNGLPVVGAIGGSDVGPNYAMMMALAGRFFFAGEDMTPAVGHSRYAGRRRGVHTDRSRQKRRRPVAATAGTSVKLDGTPVNSESGGLSLISLRPLTLTLKATSIIQCHRLAAPTAVGGAVSWRHQPAPWGHSRERKNGNVVFATFWALATSPLVN